VLAIISAAADGEAQSFRLVEKLLQFCGRLDSLRVPYTMQAVRTEAVMITLAVPGERLEIEFFADGNVEIERFVTQGVDDASDTILDEIIETLTS
jgi:hypothetical protein